MVGISQPTATPLESMGEALLIPKLTTHCYRFPLGCRHGLWSLKGSTIQIGPASRVKVTGPFPEEVKSKAHNTGLRSASRQSAAGI